MREVADSDDSDKIKEKISSLQQALMKIGEEISKKSGGDSSQGSQGPENASNSTEDEQDKDKKQ